MMFPILAIHATLKALQPLIRLSLTNAEVGIVSHKHENSVYSLIEATAVYTLMTGVCILLHSLMKSDMSR